LGSARIRVSGKPDSAVEPGGCHFPQINITGPAFLQLGNNGGFQRTNYSHSLLGVLNLTRGAHSIKTGFDGRLLLENNATYGNVSPQLQFGEAYTRGPLDNSPTAPFGQGVASFLLGIPTGGGIDLNDSRAERSPFYAFFVQDDWRILPSLTLNLGLRWEIELPIQERFDRTSRDFDFETVNPIQDQARAQYARAPIPEIAPANFNTIGGLTFAGRNGLPRAVRGTDWNAVMPRIGFAWQAHRRLVVRGGYGIFFGLLGAQFDDVSQPGFNQRTTSSPAWTTAKATLPRSPTRSRMDWSRRRAPAVD
jgi:outer membrane receptor protein involved in Fe transport